MGKKNLFSRVYRKVNKTINQNKTKKEIKWRILLITNRNSDNCGDQVIEACDKSIITTIMENLGIQKDEVSIKSCDTSIVSPAYINSKDEELLHSVKKKIQWSDMIIFGGAPVFNYLYQDFYERTSTILEIAESKNKPVIFSAIGVERYDENNKKCQRLKKALNLNCVKQITTRDGYEALLKYKTRDDLILDKVADPAVLTYKVFEPYINTNIKENKKIGIFIMRANGFIDNKIDFPREQAAKLWVDTIKHLQDKGYDYELLTSGHFGDEAFLNLLITDYGVDSKKCVFGMNSPEYLINKISNYDGVISCRLHPSIISFSLDVPSVGLVWNKKVTHFYQNIGYPERIINVDGINSNKLVKTLEESIQVGVTKDKDQLMSIYTSLFNGIKKIVNHSSNMKPYDYDELMIKMHTYPGTSEKEQKKKIIRKARRTYRAYNNLFEKANKQTDIFNLYYHSGEKNEEIKTNDNWENIISGEMVRRKSLAMECIVKRSIKNDGNEKLVDSIFVNGNKKFIGWHIRFRVKNTWFWYLKDSSFIEKEKTRDQNDIKLFNSNENIPLFPLDVESVVAEAQWKTDPID